MAKKIEKKEGNFPIRFKNLWIIISGFGLMLLGYICMMGGGSEDPNVFNPEMFNTMRLVVAPLLILIGMGVIVFGIMYRGNTKTKE